MTYRKPVEIKVGPLLDKPAPHAIEAEMAVLGAMLLDSDVIPDVSAILSGREDFYRPDHQTIYAELVELSGQHAKFDLVLVNQHLADKKLLAAVGGLDYLLSLVDAVPDTSGVQKYAQLVRDAALKRDLVRAAGKILHRVYNESDRKAVDVVDQAQGEMFNLTVSGKRAEIQPLSTLIDDAKANVERVAEHGLEVSGAIPTGIKGIDDILTAGGFHPGQLVVVAARPSIGKSVLAAMLATNAAKRGHPSVLFSCEMTGREIAMRAMASASGIPGDQLSNPGPFHTPQYWEQLESGADKAREWPVSVVDVPGLTLDRLASLSRLAVTRHGAKIIIVDYLQILSLEKVGTRNDDVSEATRRIKQMAGELNVPVVLLSQLNRGAAQGEVPPMPSLSQLRDSGSIEQDANTVLMLHREDYYRANNDPDHVPDHKLWVGIQKQRGGMTGMALSHFDGRRTHIRTWAEQDDISSERGLTQP